MRPGSEEGRHGDVAGAFSKHRRHVWIVWMELVRGCMVAIRVLSAADSPRVAERGEQIQVCQQQVDWHMNSVAKCAWLTERVDARIS